MTQAYFNPERAQDAHALPDCEVFYRTETANEADGWRDDDGDVLAAGWYWWPCFPGCMPDGDPVGPFESEDAALEDARDFD